MQVLKHIHAYIVTHTKSHSLSGKSARSPSLGSVIIVPEWPRIIHICMYVWMYGCMDVYMWEQNSMY